MERHKVRRPIHEEESDGISSFFQQNRDFEGDASAEGISDQSVRPFALNVPHFLDVEIGQVGEGVERRVFRALQSPDRSIQLRREVVQGRDHAFYRVDHEHGRPGLTLGLHLYQGFFGHDLVSGALEQEFSGDDLFGGLGGLWGGLGVAGTCDG